MATHREKFKGGQAARAWRKLAAAHAAKPKSGKKSVQTIKYPLVLPDDYDLDVEAAQRLYEVTEGTAPGSLMHLLCSVHLAGFRLFSKESETSSFRNQRHIPESEFAAAWERETGFPPGDLTAVSIIEYLLTQPRRTKTVAVPNWDSHSPYAVLYKRFRGIAPHEDDNPCEPAIQALQLFQSVLSQQFPERASLHKNAQEALKIFDASMASAGLNLPQLAPAYAKFSEMRPMASSIAFDFESSGWNSDDYGEAILHAVVALQLKRLAIEGEELTAAAARKQVQSLVTNASSTAHDGLSWLFGKGLLYWKENSLNQIIEDYEIPESQTQIIKNLHASFESIRPDEFFGDPHYAKYRQSVGGKLDSWIANYLGRLFDLDDQIAALAKIDSDQILPQALLDQSNAELVAGLGIDSHQLQNAIQGVFSKLEEIRTPMDRLLGRQAVLPVEHDVEQVELFSLELAGIAGLLEQVQNQLSMARDGDAPERKAFAEQCKLDISESLKPLPAINRISGGAADPRVELDEAVQELNQLRNGMVSLSSKLIEHAKQSGQYSSSLKSLIASEGRRFPDGEIDLQVRRWTLHRVLKLGANGSEALRSAMTNRFGPVALRSKDLNRFLHNNQGSFFRSRYSRSRHAAYEVNESALKNMNFQEAIDDILEDIRRCAQSNPSLDAMRDVIHMEYLMCWYALCGLPVVLPTEILDPDSLRDDLNIPINVLPYLDAGQISREIVIRIFNLYRTAISGVLARLFRESFSIKLKFYRVGADQLVYVPKDQQWQPPKHYIRSQHGFGDPDEPISLSTMLGTGQTLQPADALQDLVAAKALKSRGDSAGRLLRQIPHDWYVDLRLKRQYSGELLPGVTVDKKSFNKPGATVQVPARLIGPTSRKRFLDLLLVEPKETIALNEYTLIVDLRYSQSIEFGEDGSIAGITFTRKEDGVNSELAIPFTETIHPSESTHPMGQRVVGIDLGEAGIGYAVFDLNDLNGKPIATGSIPIRSVRSLIHRVKHHRNRVQPNQRFRQRFNDSLGMMRENALGDVCQAIDGLCGKFEGFPILESSVVNLASGAQQLKLVYDRVVRQYTFSNVDAHKSDKANHWYGGEQWLVPGLTSSRHFKDGKWSTTKPKSINLFPGRSVHPAGTSQTCSECYRNPIVAVRGQLGAGVRKLKWKGDGIIDVGGDLLNLKVKVPPGLSEVDKRRLHRQNARRKENPRPRYPMPGRAGETVATDKVARWVKNQLRQPQDSTRSRDTSQSVYQCLYADCGHRMHADENAAINIVRKWVKDYGVEFKRE